jgi:hypothetical protein
MGNVADEPAFYYLMLQLLSDVPELTQTHHLKVSNETSLN